MNSGARSLLSIVQGSLLVLAVSVIGLAIVGIGKLAGDVRYQIEMLAGANADSAQWSLAQSDVEVLAVIVALDQAKADGAALPELRRRFDVLYGRVGMLRNSDVFRGLTQTRGVGDTLEKVHDVLLASVPLIDADDATLSASLPDLQDRLKTVRPLMRDITLMGLRALAHESDLRRMAAGGTLLRIAMLAAALGALLAAMVVVLTVLVRKARRQAADQAHTRARLEAIISTSLDAVLVVNRFGRILEYNGAAEALFGHAVADAVGLDVADLVSCKSVPAPYAGALPPPGSGLTRVTGIRRDGTRFLAECSVDRTVSAEGEVDVCFLRDISDRLAAETALVQARDRALAGEQAKADMLAVLSHEMRTPLNGLLGTAELLSDTRMTARQRQFLNTMRSSGHLLVKLVNQVLDLLRLDAGKMKVTVAAFNADVLLAEVAASQRPLAKAQGNRLRTVLAGGGLSPVLGDEQRLRQILLNLTGNAVKFTRDGTITLTAERLAGDLVAFEVCDTGIGIAAADLLRIFDDFVTLDSSYGRAAEGTGLGLPIARRMAGVLGGRIEVQSTPGVGSRFRLVVPLAPTELAVAVTGGFGQVNAVLPTMSVLVVEDNPVNRTVLREMLIGDGHNVTEAVDGSDGVACAQAAAHDVIFMDISMPGLDGVGATRAIRMGDGPCRDVPIIALTAHALPSDLDRFADAGMTATLTKPLTRAALRAVLAGHAPPPTVDPAQAADLALGLGPEVMAKVVARFVAETTEGMADLQAGVAQDAMPDDLARLAHKLAGSAAMFGASRLRGALIALETAGRAGDRARMPALVAAAGAAWLITLPVFAAKFGTPPAPPQGGVTAARAAG